MTTVIFNEELPINYNFRHDPLVKKNCVVVDLIHNFCRIAVGMKSGKMLIMPFYFGLEVYYKNVNEELLKYIMENYNVKTVILRNADCGLVSIHSSTKTVGEYHFMIIGYDNTYLKYKGDKFVSMEKYTPGIEYLIE